MDRCIEYEENRTWMKNRKDVNGTQMNTDKRGNGRTNVINYFYGNKNNLKNQRQSAQISVPFYTDLEYDSVGNRLTEAISAQPSAISYTYNNNNELIGYDGVSFAYDNNGNMIQKTVGSEVINYIYNVENRLVRVENAVGLVIAAYYYDPFGRRLWKEVSGVRTYFHYADEGLIGEYDAGGNLEKAYGWEPDYIWGTNPVFMAENGNYYFYLNDHLGTPQKLTDINGNIVWSATYTAFGEAEVEISSTITNNLRFPGQYYDSETGLHYNWYRYYDPGTGRYVTTDPIGFEGGINLFVYVENNPVLLIDPTGLKIKGRWIQKPTVSDIDVIYKGWDFAVGKPKLLPPGIRVALIHLYASGVISFKVECTDECAEKKKWIYAPSFDVESDIDIPVRVSIVSHPLIKVAVIINAIRKGYKIAKNKFARLAATYAVDPTTWCYVSLTETK